MPQSAIWLRAFVGLLVGILPPILILIAAVVLRESLLRDVDPTLLAVAVIVATIAWAAMLGAAYARVVSDELRTMLRLAQRGEPIETTEVGTPHHELVDALEERNRQVAVLAGELRSMPIDVSPQRVATAMAGTAGAVTRDPTWRLAVLSSTEAVLLPPGVYVPAEDGATSDPDDIGDLERWAAAASPDGRPVRAEGPWGAFAVAPVAGGDHLRAVLYAPWEGRGSLSGAESAVLSLLGMAAGTAIEHAILYARVHSQSEELRRLSAVQSDFLRGVTHDLQTPLTSIAALATELRADTEMPGSARDDLTAITHQAERLRRMVGQLLVASRLEAGALSPRSEVFAVGPIVERTWSALRADRPFDLEVSGPPTLAVADPDRVEQVLWAVLDNAVKYSPAGSPVRVRVLGSGEQVAVSVADEGMGIDADARGRVFDQFFRGTTARQLAPDGSGVGLYAARGLVEAMGGSVDLDSELGRGTTVTMTLPAEPADEAE